MALFISAITNHKLCDLIDQTNPLFVSAKERFRSKILFETLPQYHILFTKNIFRIALLELVPSSVQNISFMQQLYPAGMSSVQCYATHVLNGYNIHNVHIKVVVMTVGGLWRMKRTEMLSWFIVNHEDLNNKSASVSRLINENSACMKMLERQHNSS